ncbi:hypothetical protein RN001_011899 [Aquatica leii]|uniref:Uncharacterized protein n=1 Tax=Aquatica leii TaxID=1421715 RepID=A0AAN7SD21_9COLE|nr:hypothetical protein RN001_011899 [Aquatica leii]
MICSQGSCKTNMTCTSVLILVQTDFLISHKYYKTLYGHDFNMAHIPLSSSSKQSIATQLQLGIPPATILEKIRENVDEQFKRKHLTTLKDIANIRTNKCVVNNEFHDVTKLVYTLCECHKRPNLSYQNSRNVLL